MNRYTSSDRVDQIEHRHRHQAENADRRIRDENREADSHLTEDFSSQQLERRSRRQNHLHRPARFSPIVVVNRDRPLPMTEIISSSANPIGSSCPKSGLVADSPLAVTVIFDGRETVFSASRFCASGPGPRRAPRASTMASAAPLRISF